METIINDLRYRVKMLWMSKGVTRTHEVGILERWVMNEPRIRGIISVLCLAS